MSERMTAEMVEEHFERIRKGLDPHEPCLCGTLSEDSCPACGVAIAGMNSADKLEAEHERLCAEAEAQAATIKALADALEWVRAEMGAPEQVLAALRLAGRLP